MCCYCFALRWPIVAVVWSLVREAESGAPAFAKAADVRFVCDWLGRLVVDVYYFECCCVVVNV